MSDKKQIGRIAMRVEGNYWRAYYALPGTMKGALEIGGIAMVAIRDNPDRQAAFIRMMSDVVGEIIATESGATVDWNNPVAAPQHERAGRA